MNFFSVKHFTRHGLHMNLAGKHAVGEEACTIHQLQSCAVSYQKSIPFTFLTFSTPTLIPNPLTISCEPTPLSSIPTTNDAPISSQPVTAGTHYNLRPRTHTR